MNKLRENLKNVDFEPKEWPIYPIVRTIRIFLNDRLRHFYEWGGEGREDRGPIIMIILSRGLNQNVQKVSGKLKVEKNDFLGAKIKAVVQHPNTLFLR